MNSSSGTVYSLSNHFPKYSLFKDADVKSNLAINFHKKIYADDATNQRLFKPIQIQISFDIVEILEHRRGIERHNTWVSLKNFIEKCLQQGKQEEIYFFTEDCIDRNV